MASRPASLPRWATSGATISVPASGKQDIGWVAGEAPPEGYFNWWQNLAYQWMLWLSDGDCAFHNLSATGTLGVTGVSTLGTATCTGLTILSAGGFTMTGTASMAVIIASGLITANGGLTVPTGQNLTLAGTADLKHGLRTKLITPVGGMSSSTASVIGGSTMVRTGASGGTFYRQIDMDVGARIVNVRARLKDAAGTTCTVTLFRDVDGTQTSIAVIGTSAGTAAVQTLTVNAINHTLLTGNVYAFVFTFTGAASNCDLYRIEVDYDRP